jgi:hypothetical protein
MLEFFRRFFTKHLILKALSLVLALLVWFYIVNELNKGSVEELLMLRKMLPSEGLMAKRLGIKPVFVGTPRRGYKINREQTVIVPEYCIVVGSRDVLGRIKSVYTMPIDIRNTTKTFIASIPLNPIAPGVYMEETLVQVTVPVEKEEPS